MKRNEIYQFGLTETREKKGKPVTIGNLSKRRETGKKNKTTQKCDTRQNSKFSMRKKKQEKHSEVIEIKRLGQTVRRKQLCVKHEKLK